MKIGTKRLLLALTICLLCAVLVVAFVACDEKTVPSGPPSGFDDDPWTDAEIESAFELTHSTDGYTISKYIGSETELTLPKKYKGEHIVEIGYTAFMGCDELTEVTIPDSVKNIGSYAFVGCTGLLTVTIGAGVTSIDVSAFSGCTGLTEITIPSSVTSIGSDAFYNCKGLTEITIPDSVTSIDSSAFSGCTGLTEITIPDNVESIGSYAFLDCTGLQTVTIGENVTSIGQFAFGGCTGLTEITIPDSVQSIGSSAFFNCTGLQTVYYCGTSAQWNDISIGSSNNYLINAQRYYFSEQPNYDGQHWHWNADHTAPEVWENTSQAAISATVDERNIVDVLTKQN